MSISTDIDLYSNRLGTGDQRQSDTISSLIKEIDKADLLNSDSDVLGNAYEYLIGQFASETGKKLAPFKCKEICRRTGVYQILWTGDDDIYI